MIIRFDYILKLNWKILSDISHLPVFSMIFFQLCSIKIIFMYVSSDIIMRLIQEIKPTKSNFMGSCCIQSSQSVHNFKQCQLKRRTFQKAYNIFIKIALPDKKIINRQAVEQYFNSYSQSCYDLLMREIDFNNDGIITQNQWLAYWQYIRMAGYDIGKINKQLARIQKGEVSLSFPKTKYFETNQSRITILNNIVTKMKADTTVIPFLQNLNTL